MAGDDLLEAVQQLIDLADHGRAQHAVARLSGRLSVADLLRAADGAQQVARALAASEGAGESGAGREAGHDPHDMRSLYS